MYVYLSAVTAACRLVGMHRSATHAPKWNPSTPVRSGTHTWEWNASMVQAPPVGTIARDIPQTYMYMVNMYGNIHTVPYMV